MPSTSGAGQSFNILGSSKLNTSDGKNPSASSSKPSSDQQATGSANSNDYHKQCARVHDELEAKLRDQELNGRSRGW
ncbi:MAG: hypothetical protein L6R38_005240 [Xanthoria sp. 2 TBL-2021]|nr:MAG: hypothetical protein L6R38_005240 [Xanthoria sp. 2 TBL-2021]